MRPALVEDSPVAIEVPGLTKRLVGLHNQAELNHKEKQFRPRSSQVRSRLNPAALCVVLPAGSWEDF